MLYNNMAQELFAAIDLCNIKANGKYIIWEKFDNYGRTYYGVSNFWNLDKDISIDTELSLLEWDGNEVYIDFTNPDLLKLKYIEAISILKSWKAQLKKYTNSRFCILLSYDNGSLADEETYSFTLRFWKERGNSPLISSINDFSDPVMIEYCN